MRSEPDDAARRSPALALILTGIMLAYAYFVLGPFSACFRVDAGPSSLGLTFGYTMDQVNGFFQLRNAEQLRCYRTFIARWDALFALLYTLMHAAWVRYFFPAVPHLLVIPLLHMLADWFENGCEGLMLQQYLDLGRADGGTVQWGSTLTIIKWLLSASIYGLLLIGLALLVIRALKGSRTKRQGAPGSGT